MNIRDDFEGMLFFPWVLLPVGPSGTFLNSERRSMRQEASQDLSMRRGDQSIPELVPTPGAQPTTSGKTARQGVGSGSAEKRLPQGIVERGAAGSPFEILLCGERFRIKMPWLTAA